MTHLGSETARRESVTRPALKSKPDLTPDLVSQRQSQQRDCSRRERGRKPLQGMSPSIQTFILMVTDRRAALHRFQSKPQQTLFTPDLFFKESQINRSLYNELSAGQSCVGDLENL